MFQKLLFVSWALMGSVLAKGLVVCNNQTEWLGPNMTLFQEPSTDDYSSYIFIDTPADLSADNSSCICSPIVSMFSYWYTNGTWEGDNCDTLVCDRCQVYFCAENYQVDLSNSTNVTIAADGTSTCILPTTNVTTTTTTAPTSVPTETPSNNITVEVDIHITQGNDTLNITLEYPVPTGTANITA